MNEEQLYDVVIYQRSTREVVSVVGERMLRNTGFYNAEKRYETALMRIGRDDYDAEIVPAGVKKGDILPEEVI